MSRVTLLYLFCQEYQQIVDAEWDILYDKLDKIVQSGAKVVLSKLPIGDVATQYFADRYDNLKLIPYCDVLEIIHLLQISLAEKDLTNFTCG